jgi:biotin carboxylase
LIVGRRRGALLAAARLDAEVLLLDDAGRPHRAAGAHGGARVAFDDLAGCVAAARRLIGARPIDAVVAVVERAVLPAAAIREALGLPGPGLADALPWRDKVEMKVRARAAGIRCAEHRAIEPGTDASDPRELARALGLPMVIKPRRSSGGRGAVIARSLDEVRRALAQAAAREGMATAESFVNGTELSVESLVVDSEVRFENVTNYLEPAWANVVPASLPAPIDHAVRRASRAAIEALGVKDGITHVEVFYVDHDPAREPEVYFGELGARPPGGGLMDLMSLAYGFDPWVAVLQIALGQEPTLPRGPIASAGIRFLHPGQGVLRSVSGLDEARAVPGVLEIDLPVEVGQRIGARLGTGQHTGRILVRTSSHDDTVAALDRARRLLHLELEEATMGKGRAKHGAA